MTFWFVAAGALMGLILGALGPGEVPAGILLGAAAGWLWGRQRRLARRIAALEARAVAESVAAALPRAQEAGRPAPAVPAPWAGPPVPPGMAPPPAGPGPAPGPGPAAPAETGAARWAGPPVPPGMAPPPAGPGPAPWPGPPVAPGTAPPPAGPGPAPGFGPPRRPAGPRAGPGPGRPPPPGGPGDPLGPLRRLFGEGNVPVKVGVVVLFAGVGALLKYAADAGWLRLPVELRLAGIAAAAVAALAFGFRQRLVRRTFGLAVQGGAIGILAMTVFFALRIHGLLSPAAAFAILVILTAGTGFLAVLQDSRALAVLGILAGFLAPILASTGEGNHVVLFAWYALLDTAILGVALFKAWRGLNLLGFFGTFGVGATWGVLSYEPAKFATTEPFLVFFFLLFVAIPVLHVWRGGDRRPVDGTLVFGTPLVVLGLQAGLLEGERLPLAYSALGMAAIYLALATAILRREGFRVLGEAHAILAVGAATLAVPLALSAGATAGIFALEGAALAWLGIRQSRLLPKLSGLLLEGLAAIAYFVSLFFGNRGNTPILNGALAGALLLVVGALTSAWLYHRKATGAWRYLGAFFFAVGLFWWAVAGIGEIDRFVPRPWGVDALLAFVALTAWLSAEVGRALRAPLPSWTAAATLGLAVPLAVGQADVHGHPLAAWGFAAWVAFAVAGLRVLACLRAEPAAADRRPDVAPRPGAVRLVGASRLAHLAWCWAWPVALGLTLRDQAIRQGLGDSWRDVALVLPLALLNGAILLRPRARDTLFAPRFGEARTALLGTQEAVLGLAFLVSLFAPGDSAPLPYLPVGNPQDLAGIAWGVLAAAWLGDRAAPRALADHRLAVLAGGGFLLVTAATLRAVHHLGAEPWHLSLLSGARAQAALAVVWSVLGVAGWVLGSRRANRQVWLAGAVLMGVVLVKLLVVDRQHLGNLAGIVAFLAYGLLCTVVGYLAPAPPRASPPGPEPHP